MDPLVFASPTHTPGLQLEPDKELTAMDGFQIFSHTIQSIRRYLDARRNCVITGATSSDTALVAIAWQSQQRKQEKEQCKGQGSKAPPHLRPLRSSLGPGHLADIQQIFYSFHFFTLADALRRR